MADLTRILGRHWTAAPPPTDSPEQQLKLAILAAGLNPPDHIAMDGQIHRFWTSGPKTKKSGWYVAYGDGVPAGRFGCWRLDVSSSWQANVGRQLSAEELAAVSRRLAEAKAARDADRARQTADAAAEVRRIWADRGAADPDHPYLTRKGIQPNGARVMGDGRLAVPLFAATGQLSSLQYISEDGTKRYHPGAAVGGCSWMLGTLDDPGPLYVAEGFATAATIHEMTRRPCVVAYSASNLVPVVEALRTRHQQQEIVIVADNDASGLGQRYAEQAGAKYGARVIVPPLPGDANDYSQAGHDLAALLIRPATRLWPDTINIPNLLAEAPEPPAMIIDDWLPAGYATLMAGHGGAGKSSILLYLAACMATGADFFGLPVSQRRVLYLSCEDRTETLHWRLSRICAHTGIDPADLAGRLDLLDLVGHDALLWRRDPATGLTSTPAYAELKDRMIQHGAEVLMLDGVSDVYGGNENDRAEVKQFVNAITGLIPSHGAAILLHHVNKLSAHAQGGSEGYSGSTGWHNSVRARWYLYHETRRTEDGPEPTGALMLDLQKSNLGKVGASLRFQWDEEAHLFTGAPVQGMSNHSDRDATEQAAIMDAMRQVIGAGDYVPAAIQGQRTGYHVLSATDLLPESLQNGPGKRRFWRHIEKLRRIGQIRDSSIRRSDRKMVAVLEAQDIEK